MSSHFVDSAVQSSRLAQLSLLNRRCSAWLLFAVALAGSTATAAAQSTLIASQLTIDQITEVVLQHNTDFAAAARSRDAATAAVRSARALPNPRLEIASGDNALRPASAAVAGRVETRGVAQLIENPFLRSARIDAASAGSAAAGHKLTSVRNNLVAEVRLRAFEALLRLEEEIAAREAVRLLEQIRDRVKLRVDTGEAPRFELIKADAEIISARQRQVSAAIKAEQAFITLNRLAAGRLPEKWSIAGRLADEAQPMVLEELMQQALNKSPELAVLRSLLERADANVSLAKSGRLPGVELRYQELRDPEIRQTMTGVAIQIPLLDQRQGPVAEAAAERLRALALMAQSSRCASACCSHGNPTRWPGLRSRPLAAVPSLRPRPHCVSQKRHIDLESAAFLKCWMPNVYCGRCARISFRLGSSFRQPESRSISLLPATLPLPNERHNDTQHKPHR